MVDNPNIFSEEDMLTYKIEHMISNGDSSESTKNYEVT